MSNWIVWLSLAGFLAILELFSGSFYLLMIATGFATGAALAYLGLAPSSQYLAATFVGVVATALLHYSRRGQDKKINAARDPNVNLDIGQTVEVSEWQNNGGKVHTARVPYRGSHWDIELAPGAKPDSGTFKIREIRGSCLIVTNSEHHQH